MTSGSPLDLLLDYLCILFHIDLMKFGSMLRQLRGRQDDIHALIRAVGSIDAQISIASFRESLPVYCVPDLTISKSGTWFIRLSMTLFPTAWIHRGRFF